MPFYVGADGGGTKTAYALFNEHKRLLANHEGPGSNHENFEQGFDEAAKRVFAGVQALLSNAGLCLEDIDFAFMGLAGVDHPYQYEALMQRLIAMGLTKLEIVNDGYIAVKAGCESGAGIGLNLGTGTCCNAIDLRGKRAMLAGLGEFSGDIGNGSWICTQVFRMAYDNLVLGLEQSAVTGMIFQQFGIDSVEGLMPLIQQLDCEGGTETKRVFIDIFFGAVNAGDPPARRLADQMALRGAQMITAHLRTLDFADPCEVVLSGSIHTKLPSDYYIEQLKQKAQELSSRELIFRKLERAPVMGCVDWILEEYA